MKRTCVICGKEFEGACNAKYCSPFCRNEARRRAEKEKYVPKEKELKYYQGHCRVCGRYFSYQAYQNTYRSFCSDECRRISKRIVNKRSKERIKALTQEKPKYNSKRDPKHFEKKLDLIKRLGMSYADYQRAETLKMIERGVNDN